MIQMHAFYILLVAAGVLTAAFLFVAFSKRNAREINMQSAYGLRKVPSGRYSLDWGLALMLLPGMCAILVPARVFFLLPATRRKGNLI